MQFEAGSFRDRSCRILNSNGDIYRVLDKQANKEWEQLSETAFFKQELENGHLVSTEEKPLNLLGKEISSQRWTTLLQHETLPFISYPYEWCFSMLKDAALLQLHLLQVALDENFILKDATPYNVQWRGTNPIFIDIGSFTTLLPGDPWAGYRQFCELFLYPLMLQSYKEIDFQLWLRGSLEGISSDQMLKLCSIRDNFKAGVFPHVYLQALLQRRFQSSSKSVRKELSGSGFQKELIKTNIRKLKKLTSKLSLKQTRSTWSDYKNTHSYQDEEFNQKQLFIRNIFEKNTYVTAWDLGCNTGTFSEIAAEYSKSVLAMDADHLAIENLYQRLKKKSQEKITPLVMNVSNPSCSQGWRGKERSSLEHRSSPDIVLNLALVHHIVIGSHVPLNEYIDWLASLKADIIIEFVTREDEMVKTLLLNKVDTYPDYTQKNFEDLLSKHFNVKQKLEVKVGKRIIYFCENK